MERVIIFYYYIKAAENFTETEYNIYTYTRFPPNFVVVRLSRGGFTAIDSVNKFQAPGVGG